MSEPFILFKLDKTTYGIPSKVVQQMEMVEEITSVPNSQPFVEGVVYSRGKVIPAINLRIKFGFEKVDYDLRTRLIVINTDNRTVGLIVDTAREFIVLETDSIQPPPEQISGMNGQYLSGIATLDQRIVLILDISELLKLSETISYAEA